MKVEINDWVFNFDEMKAHRDPNGPRYDQGFWDSFYLVEHNGKIYRNSVSSTTVKGTRNFFDSPEDKYNHAINEAYNNYLIAKAIGLEKT